MSLSIALSHPTFELKPKIQELTNGFLTTHGFSYFQYLRCYDNGAIGLLANDTRLMEHFQHVDNAPVVFSSFTEEHKQTPSYWFLWDEALPPAPVQLAREKFNIRNGLTWVRRSKHYYDMIAVALPQEQPNPGTFYLNKLKAIQQFIAEFDKTNKDFIKLMDKNPIALPEAYRDINYQDICLQKGKINILGHLGETYITSQELSCLRLLFQGMTQKQIAQMLELSPRTVETYLQRVKSRTGFASLVELEGLILL